MRPPVVVSPERPIGYAATDMERFGVRALLVSADLMEIFQGVGLMHLVVLEGDRPGRAAVVRGLVARSSLERRLHEPD